MKKKKKKRAEGRAKGCRGELELVNHLKARGINARRGQQYCGASGDPDVVADPPLDRVHLEVKRREAGNPYIWLAQSRKEAHYEKLPVVVHKRNGKDWVVILDLDDFIDLCKSSLHKAA